MLPDRGNGQWWEEITPWVELAEKGHMTEDRVALRVAAPTPWHCPKCTTRRRRKSALAPPPRGTLQSSQFKG
jgi:hypothetical protein